MGDYDNMRALRYTGREPTQAYHDDAGFDLAVVGDHSIPAWGEADILLASQIKSPEGMWGLLIGRSSTFKRGLLMSTGVIDPGYTGPLYAVVRNISNTWVSVKDGERIAQWIPMCNHAEKLIPIAVDALPVTARGSNGFGSSGT